MSAKKIVKGIELEATLDTKAFEARDVDDMPTGVAMISDTAIRERKDETIRASVDYSRNLIEASLDPLVTISAEGKITDVNAATEMITGVEREKLIGSDFADYFTEPEKARAGYLKVFEQGKVIGYPLSIRHSSGEITDVLYNASVYRNKQGEVLGVFASARDITERKRVEEALKETERVESELLERLNIAQHIAMIGSWEWNLLTNQVWWSDETYRIFGVSRQDFIPSFEANGKFIHPDDFENYGKSFEHSLQTGDPLQLDIRVVPGDGRVKHCHAMGKIIHDDSGRPIRFIGTLMDITERKRVEAALRESEERYRRIIETVTDYIFTSYIENGKVVKTVHGPGCVAITGYTAEEFAADPYLWFNMIIPEDRDRVEKHVSSILANRDTVPIEHRIQRKNGSERWVLNTPVLHRDTSGALISYDGLISDITKRKRAEAALVSSEVRYRRLFESAKDGILIVDAGTGMVVDVNPFLIDMLGYSHEKFLGKKVWELGVLKDIVASYDNFLELQKKEYIRYENLPLETVDGRKINVEFVSNVYLVDKKRVIQCNIRDVTERKRAEEAIARERILLRTIIDNIPIAVYAKDENGRKLLSNFFDLASFNKPESEVIGRTDMELLPKEVAEQTMADDLSVIRDGKKIVDREELIMNNSGESRWLLTSKIPWRNMEGEVVGLVGIGHDITERKRAEETLRLSASRWSSTFDAISDIVCVIANDHTFLEINKTGCDLLGLPKERIIGRKCYELMHGTTAPIAECPCEAVLKSHEFEINTYQENGRYYELSAWPMPVNDGVWEAFVHVVKDITEQVIREQDKAKLETQLLQAQKMEAVGRLAGGVAHDFNNMLSVILMHTEMALMSLDPSDPLHADLGEIHKAGMRSTDLTRQLLAFARKQTISPQVLDLNETVEGILKMLRRLIGEDIVLSWNPGNDLRQINIDPSQIDQILANLCVNARDAIADVGKIIIETSNVEFDEMFCADHGGFVPGEYVMLAVSDNGCGMNKETMVCVFEPFFTTKEIGKGTGLGLSTVYGIVKQNDGFINVYSEPGEGTTFKIYLPCYNGETVQTEMVEKTEVLQSGSETILLVEDELAILKLGKTILERLGYTVLAANSPEEAIRLADEYGGQIHLLMTDMVMPGMNGRDLTNKLLSRYPTIKSLFMSGYTADVIAHQGVLDEGMHFLQKPFSIHALATIVREVLEQT